MAAESEPNRSKHDDSFYADLARVLGRVIADVAPEYRGSFDIVGPDLLRQEVESSRSTLRGVADEFAAGIECDSVAAHLIAGTLALVEIYLHTSHLRNERAAEDNFRREWCNLLIEQGLDPELARMIPVKFSAEIMRFILNYQNDLITQVAGPAGSGKAAFLAALFQDGFVGTPAFMFDESLTPEQITATLTAFANYFRACGGVGLTLEFENQEVVPEEVHA